jgi:phosphatidylserine/phosphatidylglycerophosphate/cardiolipin synthase-like enzyme
VKLIVQPHDGVAPLLAAIKGAKKSVEIAIFRCDRKDVEMALQAAVARGVRVTALIAFASRGGEESLRQLELRCLDAGLIVARTADDFVRYHAKYILIDRRVLYVLSFNFTRLDIDRSRGFGIVTTQAACVREAAQLFMADCTRVRYAPKVGTFVVSPANSRQILGAFLRGATKQLLIYDPMISDKEMLRILQDRLDAGVKIRIIGKVSGRASFEVQKLAGLRLHTRTIIRDGHQAFVGSQSLCPAELDSRREVGLIIHDPKAVTKLSDTFETDWTSTSTRKIAAESVDASVAEPVASAKGIAKAMKIFTKEIQPLATSVKKAVRQAVAKAGEDVLHDKNATDAMKQVAKEAVKEAVKAAVHDAQEALPLKDVT